MLFAALKKGRDPFLEKFKVKVQKYGRLASSLIKEDLGENATKKVKLTVSHFR